MRFRHKRGNCPLGQEALMMLSVESHLLLLRMQNARISRTAIANPNLQFSN